MTKIGAYNPFAAGAGLNASWGQQTFGAENQQYEKNIFGGNNATTTATGINGISGGASAVKFATESPVHASSPTSRYDQHDTYRHPEMKDEFRCQKFDFLA